MWVTPLPYLLALFTADAPTHLLLPVYTVLVGEGGL